MNEEPRRFRYYIGAVHSNGVIGGTDVSRNTPIRSLDDLEEVGKMLSRHYGRQVSVLSFSRYEEEED